ncbi:Vacuolar protein sorting-associated protein vps5 [Coemansia spiralis]|uniref:Vacuolar protein sorting-associated protein vps5 n=2 Tax=Coemansia TaxID=4863 RepID=A0A9W8KYQ2_9FUNG|nr:Vacuolar protein sorting-associated protein vps5 [Coemansia umbellata]KAJ2624394.1 Vacuolar protein sorting-associated protein vps5 [Coemansia sp. RSA 1358]KAJ2677544.1 Vacuolar protein sorting-associated protein vps5 [Coemansia spiralis]
MDGDDLFGNGFGTTRQQPFTFATDEMNPFGDDNSPWGEASPTTHAANQRQPSSDAAIADKDLDKPGNYDSGSDAEPTKDSSDEVGELHRHIDDQLQISTTSLDSSNAPLASAGAHSASSSRRPSKSGVADEGNEPSPGDDAVSVASPSSKLVSSSGFAATPVQTARRVGVIKRGLRSPRVLGKKLSPAAFEDPLSSAAASSETGEISTPAAPVPQTRISVDISSAPSSVHRSAQTRQTRSLSETRPIGQLNAGFGDNSNIVSLHQSAGPPSQQPDLSQTQHHNPHPYEQQLSPMLQQEQIISARHHVEDGTARLRPSTSSNRASTAPSGPLSSRTSAAHAYLATQQRRRSLDPTPLDQIPKFYIRVTDPVKVSDSLKSYIAYKVCTQTDAEMFHESNMVVRRRYRDFDWLIQELAAKHPGIIIPPIPEKQSMGRFEDEFVEARRAGLESCLARISEHPVLWCDSVFQLFLEAEDFASKARSITEARVYMDISGKGSQLSGGGSSSSLFGDGWGSTKYKEKDEWFAKRMQEMDAIEEELRALLRALEYSQRQRQELSIAHGELSEAYLKMAGQELSKNLSNALTDMGSLQQKLKVLQSRQGVADFAGFQLTTDEYIRMIGSVRTAFAARGRAYTHWQSNLSDLIKKRKVLEGYVQNPGRVSAERITQLKGEIARTEIRTENSRNEHDDVSIILKQEMARFDMGRVRDFQAAIESYLTSLIETQEETVVLWESYLSSLRNVEPANDGSNAVIYRKKHYH